MSLVDRVLLLLTGLLAAYQVAVGIDGLETLPVIAYTIAFGVLLVAGLLLIILGFEVLSSPVVVIVSTVMPLSLSLGLVWQHLPTLRTPFLIFAVLGFLTVVFTRALPVMGQIPVLALALVHGIAGMTLFLLPLILSIQGQVQPLFALVGLGGALIGLGGLLLSFLKVGKPVFSQSTILKILPGLLLAMTVCFVAGFAFA
jgi:hypothetical protein